MTEEWLRSYAMLALRVDRQAGGPNTSGLTLIYRGPDEWREEVDREGPVAPGRLVEDAERLLDDPPFEPARAAYLAGQVRALRAVARRSGGAGPPLPDHVRECLGIEPEPVPESVFAAAHEELAAALPPSSGSLADRMAAWRAAHRLEPIDRLPALVDLAVAETRARTSAIVPLPEGEVVRCRLVSGVPFHAAGAHEGGLTSTIHVNREVPFNLADLLYVVAHEGHPGHIAESLLKETRLAGRPEQRVRFLLSPQGVISEGLGLAAEELIFPGDQARDWLARHILDGGRDVGDLAAIHRAMNTMWGVWPNATLMAAEGRPEREIGGYLSRWSLLGEDELAAAMPLITVPGGNPYLFAYYHGWRLVHAWLDAPDRRERARRLLTEQLLPADLTA